MRNQMTTVLKCGGGMVCRVSYLETFFWKKFGKKLQEKTTEGSNNPPL